MREIKATPKSGLDKVEEEFPALAEPSVTALLPVKTRPALSKSLIPSLIESAKRKTAEQRDQDLDVLKADLLKGTPSASAASSILASRRASISSSTQHTLPSPSTTTFSRPVSPSNSNVPYTFISKTQIKKEKKAAAIAKEEQELKELREQQGEVEKRDKSPVMGRMKKIRKIKEKSQNPKRDDVDSEAIMPQEENTATEAKTSDAITEEETEKKAESQTGSSYRLAAPLSAGSIPVPPPKSMARRINQLLFPNSAVRDRQSHVLSDIWNPRNDRLMSSVLHTLVDEDEIDFDTHPMFLQDAAMSKWESPPSQMAYENAAMLLKPFHLSLDDEDQLRAGDAVQDAEHVPHRDGKSMIRDSNLNLLPALARRCVTANGTLLHGLTIDEEDEYIDLEDEIICEPVQNRYFGIHTDVDPEVEHVFYYHPTIEPPLATSNKKKRRAIGKHPYCHRLLRGDLSASLAHEVVDPVEKLMTDEALRWVNQWVVPGLPVCDQHRIDELVGIIFRSQALNRPSCSSSNKYLKGMGVHPVPSPPAYAQFVDASNGERLYKCVLDILTVPTKKGDKERNEKSAAMNPVAGLSRTVPTARTISEMTFRPEMLNEHFDPALPASAQAQILKNPPPPPPPLSAEEEQWRDEQDPWAIYLAREMERASVTSFKHGALGSVFRNKRDAEERQRRAKAGEDQKMLTLVEQRAMCDRVDDVEVFDDECISSAREVDMLERELEMAVKATKKFVNNALKMPCLRG